MLKRCKTILFAQGAFFISIVLLTLSCKHEPASIENMPIVCFDTQVQTIYSASCGMAGCHSGGSGSREDGGFNPSSYTSIMRSVSPGNPWASKAYTIVSSPNNPNMMPPKGHKPLSLEQRTLIELWILQGAKDTKCDTVK